MSADTVNRMEEKLEEMIDKAGLYAVLSELAIICGEKAEHIATNWQDKALASSWARTQGQLDKLASRLEV